MMAGGMAISISISGLVLGGTAWKPVAGQLVASGVLLLSGHQDVGLLARIAATFSCFMALAFAISALITALVANLRDGVVICTAALCLETWLILRWWTRRTSAQHRI
jgi:hypothetical protein